MLGLLRRFGFYNNRFGLDSEQRVPQLQPLPPIFAPGTRIPYDPALVDRLKQEHDKLLRLFTEMMRNANHLQLADARYLLNQFETTYNNYILLEFTKLYVYLECCMRTHPKNHAVVRCFRKKMNSVNRYVRVFLGKWKNELTLDSNSSFLNHAKQIGLLLFARTKAEADHLYDIYDQCPVLVLNQQAES